MKILNKNSKYKVLFMLGPPGSGKGTQCSLLVNKLNILHISAGELLRRELAFKSETSNLIENYMTMGKIVPVKITCGLLRKEMELNQNKFSLFLIDGFPRNFDNFDGWNQEMSHLVDVISTIFIDCKKDEVIKRIKERSLKEGRLDDSIETLEKRIVSFEKETKPVIEELSKTAPLIKIDGLGNPKEIHNELIKTLRYLI